MFPRNISDPFSFQLYVIVWQCDSHFTNFLISKLAGKAKFTENWIKYENTVENRMNLKSYLKWFCCCDTSKWFTERLDCRGNIEYWQNISFSPPLMLRVLMDLSNIWVQRLITLLIPAVTFFNHLSELTWDYFEKCKKTVQAQFAQVWKLLWQIDLNWQDMLLNASFSFPCFTIWFPLLLAPVH